MTRTPRSWELKALEERFASDRFEFLPVLGPRRVGKTTLLREFFRGKRGACFTGLEGGAQTNLRGLSAALFSGFGFSPPYGVFLSFEQALEYAFEQSLEERTVLILDDYQLLVRADPSVSSILQHLIDRHKDASKLMLLICGAPVDWMEANVMGYCAALYGRRTGQLRVNPLGFFEARRLLPGLPSEDAAILYGSVGGMPRHLARFAGETSAAEALKRHWFSTDGCFFDEAMAMLRQEVRALPTYVDTLAALANGSTRLADIARETKRPTAAVIKTLAALELLDIVRKETPLGARISRQPRWRIADDMFRFWFRFILMDADRIADMGPEAYLQSVEWALEKFMAPVFVRICTEYLWHCRRLEKAPVPFRSARRWWGRDERTKTEVEIDIVAEVGNDRTLFGACRWTAKPVTEHVLLELDDLSGHHFRCRERHLWIFSRAGFTEGCVEAAKRKSNVRLVTFAEMVREVEAYETLEAASDSDDPDDPDA